MAVFLTEEQLPELLDSLKDNRQAFSIRGEIKAKLNNVITDNDFIVDSWPDYKALVVRVNPTRAKHAVHLGRRVGTFAWDCAALETLLQTPGLLDWSQGLVFLYVSPNTRSTIENLICKQDRPYKTIDSFFYTATKESLKISPIPDGFSVCTLRPDQASFVNSTWKFMNGKHSENYIRDLVSKTPSCCLYDKDENVVGFAVQYHLGALGMLHVLEKYRGKGYAKVIMSHLAFLCLEKENETFLISDYDNVRSVRLHESIGFVKEPDCMYAEFWVGT